MLYQNNRAPEATRSLRLYRHRDLSRLTSTAWFLKQLINRSSIAVLDNSDERLRPLSQAMSVNMDPQAVAVGPASVSPSAPSPSLSPASGATPIKTEPGDGKPSGPNSARRPPRKSTLTQQQKNQKRQRATQDQLATLEMEFSKNPTPTADVRDRIAEEINMTQRSVQIWFQNR